jgi:glycosyltransferase involved in cell wall biosynthesis
LPNLPDACNFTQALINIAPNKGKGNAVRTGAQAAKPGYLLFTDADFPYTVESFLKIVRAIEAGNNVVPGVRNQSYYQGVTTFRSRLSRMHSWFIRSLIGITISDTQCGLKGFDAIGVQVLLRTQIHRFLFDLELICRAQNNREIKVETVEVDLRPTVEVSQFGVAVLLKEGINFAKIVFLNANGKLK